MIYIYNNIGTFTKYHINIDSMGFQALLLFSWGLFSFEHLLGYKAPPTLRGFTSLLSMYMDV